MVVVNRRGKGMNEIERKVRELKRLERLLLA